MPLEQLIEAIIFWKGEPVATSKLAEAVGRSEDEVQAALARLEQSLASRGVRLIRKDDEVTLGTAPEASETISRLTKEELSRDLGKAGLETLTIVLYRGPIARAEIDYLRGVNSSFILRHLQIRDLVERLPDPADARRFLYRPTFNLLQHLGVTKIEDLPEWTAVKAKLSAENDSHDS